MNRLYLATVIAVAVTTLLASVVLALGAARSAIPGMLARLKFDLEWVLRGAKTHVDDWIAASIARRERDAVISMLHDLGDRQSSDGRLDRGCIDGCCSQPDCLAGTMDRSAVSATEENGR